MVTAASKLPARPSETKLSQEPAAATPAGYSFESTWARQGLAHGTLLRPTNGQTLWLDHSTSLTLCHATWTPCLSHTKAR